MAVIGYPFEDQDTTETQYSRLAREWLDPGVMAPAGSGALAATTPGGMVTRIAAGRAHGNGYVLDNTSTFDVPHDPAGSGDRVDRVVARVNPILNRADLVALTGTNGSNVPPALTRTDAGVFEVPLWRVPVGAGAAGPGAPVDEREWVSSRVGVWTTVTRPTVATGLRPGKVGANLTTGRLEWNVTGVDGAWVPLLEPRDTRALTWHGRRSSTDPLPPAQFGTLASVTLPGDAPAGRYMVSYTAVISSASGATGFLRGEFGGQNATQGDDAFTIPTNGRGSHTAVVPFTHSGGAVEVATRGQAVNGGLAEAGSRVTVWFVGAV